ncbi:Essential protein Yae1, N terminal [Lecanora helva]
MAATPPSTPPSPSSQTGETPENSLSDIFSDSPPSTPRKSDINSDIPRLRSTHVTAGYREGISTSKTRSLQPGFDEGYPLGATFGLRVGFIFGALEGLYSAQCGQREHREKLQKLFKQAQEQLELVNIFSKNYWDERGVWKYDVEGKGEEVTFQEVVNQHPIIRIWDGKVEEQMAVAGVKSGRFEGEEWEAGRV